MVEDASIEGPAWCAPGLATRSGVYPLAVEQPVMSMVSLLVPGVTSLTTIARYFSLYWALADFADSHNYDATACRSLVRNAEVGLAWASALNPATGDLTGSRNMHGADSVHRLLREGGAEKLAGLGAGSYSTRSWGYWSQYKGSSLLLKIATSDRNAIRRGPRVCPEPISKIFEPLLQLCSCQPPAAGDIPRFVDLNVMDSDSADVVPLRELLTASRQGSHRPEDWLPADQMRRSTLRILARSAQVCPSEKGWRFTLAGATAYGSRIETDPIFLEEHRQTRAWRGLLLRHHSVGAWRVLWSALVDEVLRNHEPVSRDQLHDWIRAHVGSCTVEAFVDQLPSIDEGGQPAPAEDKVLAEYATVEASIAVLLLGALRIDHLDDESLEAFSGGSARRRLYLDPYWVAGQYSDYKSRTMGDFACALVDDMLAQSHRVALRKMRVENNGQMVLPTKLHEREDRWFADSSEGSGNVGIRARELGQICTQLGIFEDTDGLPQVTEVGRRLLRLPE